MKKIMILLMIIMTGAAWYVNLTAFINEPKEYQAHVKKADEYYEKGIYVDAITEYESALEYRPDNMEIKMNLAKAYLGNEDSSRYVSLCKEIAEEDQDNTEALDSLVHYYTEQGAEEEAVKYLNEFVSDYPDNKNANQWFLKLKGSYSDVYCWYQDFGTLYNGYCTVSQDGLWGITDAEGDEIIEPEFDSIQVFSEDGFALANKDGKNIYIDKEGQTRMVPEEEYSDLGMYSSGRVRASQNGKFGLLDSDMEPVTDFEWDNISSIYNDIGAACKDGKWAIIDESGKNITDYIYDDVAMDEYGFCNKQGLIFVKKGTQYNIINENGESVGNLSFKNVKCFNEDGYAAVSQNGKWGFVDSEGEMVTECIYDDALSFCNGYAAVASNGLWGYIDEDNYVMIKATLNSASSFSDVGTALIEKDGEKSLIQLDLYS